MTNRLFFTILVSVFVLSCSNDFELTENWKDIPVVYGLLDQSDSVQYIRVEKAFLDESTSALILAQNPDSIFYQDISVELQETPIGGAGVGAVYLLDRVDANLEGYAKEDGIFASSPNYVYKLDEPLKENALYRLIINNNATDETVTATTRIAEDFELFSPLEGSTLRMEPGSRLTFQWRTQPNSSFFDIALRIHYAEAPFNDPTNRTFKSIDWRVATRVKPSTSTDLVLVRTETKNFYTFMQASLDVDPNIVRTFINADVVVNAGGEDLLKYIEIGLANSGITGSETLPTYTNLSEGFGIFSTRYTKIVPAYNFSADAKDSLKAGQYTRELNFQ